MEEALRGYIPWRTRAWQPLYVLFDINQSVV